MTADGGRYVGPVSGGRFDGTGRMDWPNGARYEGGFKRGLFSGRGVFHYANGDRYEGEFADGMRSGKGKLVFANGEVYEGDFRKDVFEGQGRVQTTNGAVYEGQFRGGYLAGRGSASTRQGRYTGEFRHGEYDGTGEFTSADGRRYQGQFVGGLFHGKGRYETPQGESYEGDFEQGEFTGTGTYSVPGGMRHEGRFANWRPEGPGRLIDPEGNSYEGEFRNGDLVGVARLASKDGSSYEGEVRAYRPNGKGTLRRPNGDVYVGQFEFGSFHGEGTLTYAVARPDGRTQDSGTWRYGRLKAEADGDAQRMRANVEAALYNQPRLLTDTLATLTPRDPRRINMFLLAVAGAGAQEVFRREVEFVQKQFDADFGTRGHAIALVNSRSTVTTAPMASVTSIRRALGAIANRMDPARDILFLYVTSHGSKDHELSLGLAGMELPGLKATELASALKESGIRWKVVVVSACYAGGFMDALKDEHTLVLAAARHDRRSFGCADENDFTYFGRAFFKEALPRSDSFEAAFQRATTLIEEWEKRDAGRQPASTPDAAAGDGKAVDLHSLPQMQAGAAISAHLQAWWKSLPQRQGVSAATAQAPSPR